MDNDEINILLTFIIGLLLLGNINSAAAIDNSLGNDTDFTDSVNCKSGAGTEAKIKNVIILIPDGCSQSVQTLARWFSGKPLKLDEMVAGTVSTYSTDSVITDSSSAATAFATGYKTTNGFVSVGPSSESVLSVLEKPSKELQYTPLATILEGSKLEGKATGLVATSRVTHATPAAFASHVDNRDNENEIMEQMVYEDIDIVFGGGSRHLLPDAEGGKRTDGENLKQVLLDRGYQYVDTKDEMLKLSSGKTWGLFASSHMSPDIDRFELTPEEPSLSEMTGKAVELLSQDQDGFFLMVEGSQVDWANHANDPNYAVTEFLAFDKAVKTAVDFAKKDGHTLVLVIPDHNTGGMTIGSYSDANYTSTTVEDVVVPLKRMKLSSTGLVTKIGTNLSPENIKTQLKTWWDINASDEDIAEILKLYNNGKGLSLDYAISEVVSRKYTVIGWTTHGHSGDDVPLWAYGPDSPKGYLDNTEIAKCVSKALGFDLNKTNSRLFVETDEIFSKDNGDGKLDKNEYLLDKTDSLNPVLKIGDAELPVDKDILVKNGVMHQLKGIVIYTPAKDEVFIPSEVLSLIDGAKAAKNENIGKTETAEAA